VSEDIFRHADRALMVMLNAMSREFQNLSTEIGFDEMNVMETRKQVNAMYERMDRVIRREYRGVARKAYMDAGAEAGRPDSAFDAEKFVAGMLRAYDPVSDFVYEREWTRKRDRLFESIIATERGNQEMRRNLKRGLDVLANQVRQYADNITAQARVTAFKRAGADVLVWITEDDEKVCKVCRPRHEQFYPIEMLPEYPAHWHCRCRLDWVDMEEWKRRKSATEARNAT
jgi:SPP1 gp7 family putative phage head morphogenesis protein